MGTAVATVTHMLDCLSDQPGFSARKMFGEYALYLDGKVVALICDDQVFVRPTPGAVALATGAVLAPPYPTAKPHLLLTDLLDDPDALIRILRTVAAEVPAPKPKKPKKEARNGLDRHAR